MVPLCRKLGVLGLVLLGIAVSPAACSFTPVRVTFLTDCTMYSDWQSLGMIFSFKMSGQPGKVTRVMCCSDKQKAKYNPKLLNYVETHTAPDMTVHPRTGDNYAAYNKPEAVIDYLDHVTPEEEYVLVLDSDMILRRPFLVEAMKPSKGMAVGARYTYMIGVNNELATRHIPEIAPRNDTLAGPYGRRADQVGGFFFIHRDDLKRMSHDWLRYTEDVRADDQAYRLSGDVYAITPGSKPWISEMYGYAFGAAKANVWHRWDTDSMIYPEYQPRSMPKLMHYGLQFTVKTANGKAWSFDKHHHYDFDVNLCPPWDLTDPRHRRSGVFDWPPRPSELTPWESKGSEAMIGAYRDLLSIETASTMNAAFCEYHLSHCPPSAQLVTVCTEAFQRYREVADMTFEVEKKISCTDWHAKCSSWSEAGECKSNKEYMEENCRKACKACVPEAAIATQAPTLALAESTLASFAKRVKDGGDVVAAAESPAPAMAKVERVATAVHTEVLGTVPAIVVPHLKHPRPKTGAGSTDATMQQSGGGATRLPHKQAPAKAFIQAASKDSSKVLLLQCYRMSLTVTEVKECAAMAKMGKAYVRDGAASTGGALATSKDEDTGKAALQDAEDLALTQGGRDAPPKEDGQDGGATVAAAPSTVRTLVAGLSVYQAVAVGLVAVAVLALAVPRLVGLLRSRAGKRSRSRAARSE